MRNPDIIAWQNSLREKAGSLPAILSYGLGIRPGEKAEEIPDALTLPAYTLSLSDGVALTPLEEVGESNIMGDIFSSPDLLIGSTRVSCLLGAQSSGGLFIIAGGKEGEEIIVNASGDGKHADTLVLIAKRGSRVTIVEDLSGKGFFARTTFLVVEEGARVNWIQTATGGGVRHVSRTAFVHQRGEVVFVDVPGDGPYVRSDTDVHLVGEEARLNTYAFLKTNSTDILDINTHVSHAAHRTQSHVHALGFSDNASRLLFRAEGRIAPRVTGVSTQEEARFILLSRDARVDAIPAIDIASREVTATHKLSVSPMSERDLFFPRSRGFSDSAARELLTGGLIASELACIKNDMIRAILESRVC